MVEPPPSGFDLALRIARRETSFDDLGDLGDLVAASLAEGFGFVTRLAEEWAEGAPGGADARAALLEARGGGSLVGVCTVVPDPYETDPTVGRLRHLYVRPEVRGAGVGRALVAAALRYAAGSFRLVRLRAGPPDAAGFWDALGFERVADPAVTHLLRAPFGLPREL